MGTSYSNDLINASFSSLYSNLHRWIEIAVPCLQYTMCVQWFRVRNFWIWKRGDCRCIIVAPLYVPFYLWLNSSTKRWFGQDTSQPTLSIKVVTLFFASNNTGSTVASLLCAARVEKTFRASGRFLQCLRSRFALLPIQWKPPNVQEFFEVRIFEFCHTFGIYRATENSAVSIKCKHSSLTTFRALVNLSNVQQVLPLALFRTKYYLWVFILSFILLDFLDRHTTCWKLISFATLR